MPIQGLSTRDVIQPRFRTLGKLRKGGEKTGNRPGRDLDYFRFVPDNGRADIRQAFVDAYGEKPERLEIRFPFPTMEENFRSWREDYGANHLCKLRCDGARWHDWIQGDRHYHSEEGRECEFKYRDTENRCPQCPLGYYGYLDVILPGMWYNGQIGLVTVLTTSINDIARLSAKLVQWEPLNGKPFLIWREIETIGIPVKGKRSAKDVSLIHLELTEEQMVQAFLEAGAQDEPELLPETAGDPRDLDYDGEIIEGEPPRQGDYHGAPMDADAYDDLRDDEREQAQRAADLEREEEEQRRTHEDEVLAQAGHAADVAEAQREMGDLEPETAARRWPAATIDAVMAAEYARPEKHAIHMLNLSDVLRTTDEVDFVLDWCKRYKSQRPDKEAEDAAKWADEQMPTAE